MHRWLSAYEVSQGREDHGGPSASDHPRSPLTHWDISSPILLNQVHLPFEDLNELCSLQPLCLSFTLSKGLPKPRGRLCPSSLQSSLQKALATKNRAAVLSLPGSVFSSKSFLKIQQECNLPVCFGKPLQKALADKNGAWQEWSPKRTCQPLLGSVFASKGILQRWPEPTGMQSLSAGFGKEMANGGKAWRIKAFLPFAKLFATDLIQDSICREQKPKVVWDYMISVAWDLVLLISRDLVLL